MNTLKTSLILSILFVISSCFTKSKQGGQNNLETRISLFQQTEFISTLESKIDSNKNLIYTPVLLYAWDKIKKEFHDNIALTDTNSDDFVLLCKSQSYLNSLTNKEYNVNLSFDNEAIIAQCIFKKKLAFNANMKKLDNTIHFKNSNVEAFGMYMYDEDVVKFTTILYYNDDNNFILKLSPKGNDDEIILVKGIQVANSFSDVINQTNEFIKIGKKEAKEPIKAWRYEITDGDQFSIPSIDLKFESNISSLEGQYFKVKEKRHFIQTAYQKTNFTLNDKGAFVEGEGYLLVDSMPIEINNSHPKKMIFDSPFYIIIRKSIRSNPSFMMKVENSEVMKK